MTQPVGCTVKTTSLWSQWAFGTIAMANPAAFQLTPFAGHEAAPALFLDEGSKFWWAGIPVGNKFLKDVFIM